MNVAFIKRMSDFFVFFLPYRFSIWCKYDDEQRWSSGIFAICCIYTVIFIFTTFIVKSYSDFILQSPRVTDIINSPILIICFWILIRSFYELKKKVVLNKWEYYEEVISDTKLQKKYNVYFRLFLFFCVFYFGFAIISSDWIVLVFG